jgi:FecR protein
MRVRHRSRAVLLMSVAANLVLASVSFAQEHAGVVTTLEGRVTVARATSPEPVLLKFRDAVFVRDRIATGKESFARILLGGRAVVTVREYSAVTITEVPGVATVDVGSGRVAVAVARERMRPGDLVEVRTPNAVAGIRGTVIVAEVFDAQRSVITVLKGVIEVTHLDAGGAVGGATVLNALQQVTVTGAVSAPQTISSDAAQRMGAEFRTAPPMRAPKAATAAVAQTEVERVAKEMGGAAATATGRESDEGPSNKSGTAIVATSGVTSGPSKETGLGNAFGLLKDTKVDNGKANGKNH